MCFCRTPDPSVSPISTLSNVFPPQAEHVLVDVARAVTGTGPRYVLTIYPPPPQAEHVLVDMARGDIVAPADLPPPRKQFSGVTTVPKDRVPKVG